MKKLVLFEGRKMAWSLFTMLATVLLLGVCVIDVWRPWDAVGNDVSRLIHEINPLVPVYLALTPEEQADLTVYVSELQQQEDFSGLSEEEYRARNEQINEQWRNQPGRYTKSVYEDVMLSQIWRRRMSFDNFMPRREMALETSRRLLAKAEIAGNSYEIRRNKTLIAGYSAPLPVNYYLNDGYNALIGKSYLGYLPYLLVILMTAGAFSSDRQSGSWMWLNASRRGRGTVAVAKYAAAGCLAFFTSLLFSVTAIAVTGIKFGLPGLNMPLASTLSGAEMTPYQLTVWQFLLLYTLIPALGAVFLSAVCCLISQYNRNSFLSMGLCVVFAGLSFGYGIVTGLQSYTAEPLKLPNILNWLDPLAYLFKYNTANIFGFPVSWIWVHAALWVPLTAGIVMWGFKKDMKVAKAL